MQMHQRENGSKERKNSGQEIADTKTNEPAIADSNNTGADQKPRSAPHKTEDVVKMTPSKQTPVADVATKQLDTESAASKQSH